MSQTMSQSQSQSQGFILHVAADGSYVVLTTVDRYCLTFRSILEGTILDVTVLGHEDSVYRWRQLDFEGTDAGASFGAFFEEDGSQTCRDDDDDDDDDDDN